LNAKIENIKLTTKLFIKFITLSQFHQRLFKIREYFVETFDFLTCMIYYFVNDLKSGIY